MVQEDLFCLVQVDVHITYLTKYTRLTIGFNDLLWKYVEA